jgi:phosphoribosyl-AMP cyclohydrolase
LQQVRGPDHAAMADIAPTGTPGEVERLVQWNAQGLVVAIAQDRATGDVLMVAWADRAALTATLTTGKATYFSRSRGRLWVKGEESGWTQRVLEVRIDCDGDALLYVVDAPGPACHQLRRSCFSHRVDGNGAVTTDRPVIA